MTPSVTKAAKVDSPASPPSHQPVLEKGSPLSGDKTTGSQATSAILQLSDAIKGVDQQILKAVSSSDSRNDAMSQSIDSLRHSLDHATQNIGVLIEVLRPVVPVLVKSEPGLADMVQAISALSASTDTLSAKVASEDGGRLILYKVVDAFNYAAKVLINGVTAEPPPSSEDERSARKQISECIFTCYNVSTQLLNVLTSSSGEDHHAYTGKTATGSPQANTGSSVLEKEPGVAFPKISEKAHEDEDNATVSKLLEVEVEMGAATGEGLVPGEHGRIDSVEKGVVEEEREPEKGDAAEGEEHKGSVDSGDQKEAGPGKEQKKEYKEADSSEESNAPKPFEPMSPERQEPLSPTGSKRSAELSDPDDEDKELAKPPSKRRARLAKKPASKSAAPKTTKKSTNKRSGK
jgi:hypothetical protein